MKWRARGPTDEEMRVDAKRLRRFFLFFPELCRGNGHWYWLQWAWVVEEAGYSYGCRRAWLRSTTIYEREDLPALPTARVVSLPGGSVPP